MEYISNEDYAENVDARCSTEFHQDNVNGAVFANIVLKAAAAADNLDKIKKALFYNKVDDDLDAASNAYASMFREEAGRDWIGGALGAYHDGDEPITLTMQEQNILHAIIGLVTEGGELLDALIEMMRKKQQREEGFDLVNLREEFGDALWYIQLGLNAIGSNIPECMTINDNKLERRFGPAFSSDRANNRDLDAERKELEGGH